MVRERTWHLLRTGGSNYFERDLQVLPHGKPDCFRASINNMRALKRASSKIHPLTSSLQKIISQFWIEGSTIEDDSFLNTLRSSIWFHFIASGRPLYNNRNVRRSTKRIVVMPWYIFPLSSKHAESFGKGFSLRFSKINAASNPWTMNAERWMIHISPSIVACCFFLLNDNIIPSCSNIRITKIS